MIGPFPMIKKNATSASYTYLQVLQGREILKYTLRQGRELVAVQETLVFVDVEGTRRAEKHRRHVS